MSKTDKKDVPVWSSKWGMIFAFLGSAVGLANIWRFPKVLYANGGSSFMVPYIIALITIGLCAYLLEISIGYKFRECIPKLYYRIKKDYEWLGWFILISLFLCCSYYITIIGWDLIFLVLSFTKAWGSDPNFFFTNTLLQSTDSLYGIKNFVPLILLALMVCWLIVYGVFKNSINKGVEKMCNYMMPALLIIIAIIVVYALTLPGAYVGYNQIFSPNWGALLNLDVWLAAFTQIAFTLGLGWGILTAYGVYIPEDTNLVSMSCSIPFGNSAFEVFHAIGLFSILGFMSFTTGVAFNSLITDGSGLTFIVLPYIFNHMGAVAFILGPLYFLAIFFAGLTSFGALLEPIIVGIMEKFNLNRKKAASIIILLCALCSLIYTTQAGSWLLNIADSYVSYFCFLVVIILECIIFGWIYNIDDLMSDNIGNFPKHIYKVWKVVIKFVIPIILTVLVVNAIFKVFVTMSFMEHVVLCVFIVLSIVVPVVLTKLSAKNKEYYAT